MSIPLPVAERSALRVLVTGVVQGVGFRPFVHRLALRYGLAGGVRNRAGDVQIDVEGPPAGLDAFVRALAAEAPPLARIERIQSAPRAPAGRDAFVISPSAEEPDGRQPVAPDAAMCSLCEVELSDPANRRYRYPFITCTDCGPRYTVIEALPYDRQRTSMRPFVQCQDCRREYDTPGDRRYHSETNSCPACGPRVWLDSRGPGVETGFDAIRSAAGLLAAGQIVAIRGLGGFHLAVDATDEHAVRRLRERKRRDAKPLAIMVRTLDDARALARVEEEEAELLQSRERPIVLLKHGAAIGHAAGPLAPSIAPGLDRIGVMLAYTPLHHLLLAAAGRPLVMTSGNLSEEPIAIGNEDALRRLRGVADAFLLHDREIVARYDDSVLRVVSRAPGFVRRARGYAPLPLDIPVESPVPLVAMGPHLKNTLTLVHGRRAYVSQHIGDLENLETLEHFQATLAAYRRLFRVAPEVAAHDLHPDYLSTRAAAELGLARLIAVQHHHAHVAAVLAEHAHTGLAIGVAYDGTGYGADDHTWGAEVLVSDLTGYRRAGRLRYAPLPGGDAAARRPWRVAAGYLSLEPSAARAFARAFDGVAPDQLTMVTQQLATRLNTPLASSMGRLFDAAAAVLGVRRVAQYEGQAAMELEALAGDRPASPLPMPLAPDADGCLVLDPLPLLAALGERAARGALLADLAAAFHESVAAGTAELVARVAAASHTRTAALGGGVFQNARLLTSLTRRITAQGIEVLVPRRLPPNDGAVSYGQAAVAAARLRAERDG